MSLRDQLTARITQHAQDVVEAAQQQILDDLDEIVPVNTGALRDSRIVREDTGPTNAGFEVNYPLDYAEFTDTGTNPHEIRGNPLLAFDFGGSRVIVRSVQHPGTPATLWWTNIMNQEWWALTLRLAAERVG